MGSGELGYEPASAPTTPQKASNFSAMILHFLEKPRTSAFALAYRRQYLLQPTDGADSYTAYRDRQWWQDPINPHPALALLLSLHGDRPWASLLSLYRIPGLDRFTPRRQYEASHGSCHKVPSECP